jgi:hypothetical protein
MALALWIAYFLASLPALFSDWDFKAPNTAEAAIAA